MNDISKTCDECKHIDKELTEEPCKSCKRSHIGYDHSQYPDNWGPQESAHIADSGDRRKPVSYRENIIALIDRQHDKGLSKYGETLEENTTLSSAQRIDHAEEELVDALQYLEHLKAAVSDSLTANDYQRMAMRTALGMDYGEKEENGLLLNGLMGLNGEAGECIDIMKKHIFQGHELDREHLIEELGDCAWYLAVSCEGLGVTLEEVMQRNVDKLVKRYPEGFDKARSINRKGESDK